ncbi:MAG: hypothetical protein HKP58_01835 [Desulfatitalea sp.]|nr:hypothetical protein [Desulfatitalea sp.]NNJ99128.1 hypothetical protein [Desulfatitalea sp.]
MSDELFDQALKTWGEKKTLRHILFVGFAFQCAMFQNACKLRWVEEPIEWSDPNMVQHANEQRAIVKESLQALYVSLAEYAAFA